MLMNLLLGALPEILYFYFYIKNILKVEKKKSLFVSIVVIFLITIMAVDYNIYLYILFDILLYLVLKKINKSQITDFFFLIFLEVYLYLMSGLCYFAIPNYVVAYIINRILLFIPLLFKDKILLVYNKYKSLWNRKKGAKIKSLTLRNISVIVINVLLVLGYLTLLYISK